jgi:hypothetical protein
MIDWDTVAQKLRFPSEKAMWEYFYNAQVLPISTIADRFGVNQGTVRDALRRCGLIIRQRGGPHNKGSRRWPKTDDELLALVEKFGVIKTAKRIGLEKSTVFKRVRRIREARDGRGRSSAEES